MKAIAIREIHSYFNTMIGYVFMGICMLVCGIFFAGNNIIGGSASIAAVIGSISYVLILTIPLLTMRSFAEEKKNKSDQLLLTAPVSTAGIVLGKYLSAMFTLGATLLASILFPIIIALFGEPYIGEIVVGYLGVALLGSAFIAIGLFVSSISENQLTAAVATIGILFFLWLFDSVLPQVTNPYLNTILSSLSLYSKLATFQIGILSVAAVVYFCALTFVFLFITSKVTEKRRWGKS